jgi:hypothetical protein
MAQGRAKGGWRMFEAWRVKRQLKRELLGLAVELLPVVRNGLPAAIALLELQRGKLAKELEDKK